MISVVPLVLLRAVRASPASAQMTGAPDARLPARRRACASSTMPAPLREIGFDQNLDQPLPLDAHVPRRARAARCALGDYFGKQAGRARVRLLRVPDALHAGAERADEHARACCRSTPARTSTSSLVSFDPRETPAQAAREEGDVPRSATSGRAPTAGWHFLTGDAGRRSSALTKAAGFRYVWDEQTQAVRAPDRHHRRRRPTAGSARYLFGIEYGPRDLRLALVEASAGQDRHRSSISCCSSATTTTR